MYAVKAAIIFSPRCGNVFYQSKISIFYQKLKHPQVIYEMVFMTFAH
ncbi:hypothetical protein PBAL39_19529 [Pedobacter sp. BAL39]|nr:hypothetical protein PBAL39_19529 [Pedobacter sp. BAL39]